jgi:hypothetical protein
MKIALEVSRANFGGSKGAVHAKETQDFSAI